MSNDLAVATVTATLKRILENALTSMSGLDVKVTTTRPDKLGKDNQSTGVNIFLYQVATNPSWRNVDLPTRRADGTLSQRPQVALDLYYLLSFNGDETKLVPERLLGRVVRVLHEKPILTGEMILQTLQAVSGNNDLSFLSSSNFAEQTERMKFSPIPLSLEDLSKLWSVFFQTPYALSVAYQGSVVLIESEEQPQTNKPVSDRNIQVAPL